MLLAQMEYQWNYSLRFNFSCRAFCCKYMRFHTNQFEWNILVIASPTEVLSESSKLVRLIHISVASAATTQSNSVIQHLKPPLCSDVVRNSRLMWNINTGAQARKMSAAINYSKTRGQSVLIFP